MSVNKLPFDFAEAFGEDDSKMALPNVDGTPLTMISSKVLSTSEQPAVTHGSTKQQSEALSHETLNPQTEQLDTAVQAIDLARVPDIDSAPAQDVSSIESAVAAAAQQAAADEARKNEEILRDSVDKAWALEEARLAAEVQAARERERVQKAAESQAGTSQAVQEATGGQTPALNFDPEASLDLSTQLMAAASAQQATGVPLDETNGVDFEALEEAFRANQATGAIPSLEESGMFQSLENSSALPPIQIFNQYDSGKDAEEGSAPLVGAEEFARLMEQESSAIQNDEIAKHKEAYAPKHVDRVLAYLNANADLDDLYTEDAYDNFSHAYEGQADHAEANESALPESLSNLEVMSVPSPVNVPLQEPDTLREHSTNKQPSQAATAAAQQQERMPELRTPEAPEQARDAAKTRYLVEETPKQMVSHPQLLSPADQVVKHYELPQDKTELITPEELTEAQEDKQSRKPWHRFGLFAKKDAQVEEPDAEAGVDLTLTPELASEMKADEDGSPLSNLVGWKKGLLISLAAAAALALLVYLGGSIYFSNHFFPNTTLDNRNVSMSSMSEAASTITQDTSNFVAHLSGENLTLDIAAQDIGLNFDSQLYVDTAKSQQNAWAWPAELNKEHKLRVEQLASFNAGKLKNLLTPAIDAANKDATDPKDATVAYSEDEKKYVVVDEVLGTKINFEALMEHVSRELEKLSETIQVDENCLMLPQVTHTDERLTKAVEDANRYVTMTIPLNMNGNHVIDVTPELIRQWVTLNEKLEVSFDEAKVGEWTNGAMADVCDTVGKERSFTLPDGTNITIDGGTYGWISDSNATTPLIVDAIKNAKSDAIEIPLKQSAQTWTEVGKAEWDTNTTIEANLSTQHARFFKGGELIWESDFVSGNTSDNHGTPTGIYAVNDYKTTDSTLIGLDEDDDNEPDYRTHVNYWIPFSGNLVAFHDADWRYTFGGDVYTYNGSHGCINLPVDAARVLYDIAEIGTVVVVHW